MESRLDRYFRRCGVQTVGSCAGASNAMKNKLLGMPGNRQHRLLTGFVLAGLAAVFAAFVGGCIYAVLISNEDALTTFRKVILEGEPALKVFLYVGGISALVAAMVASVTIILVGIPLYSWAKRPRYASLGTYLATGVVVSMVLVVILALGHVFHTFLLEGDFWFSVVLLVVGGQISTLTFWAFVRPDRLEKNE